MLLPQQPAEHADDGFVDASMTAQPEDIDVDVRKRAALAAWWSRDQANESHSKAASDKLVKESYITGNCMGWSFRRYSCG
jgi:hypothetical protein